jgi:pimeloyl-ACP methyl ester carboxylesterase
MFRFVVPVLVFSLAACAETASQAAPPQTAPAKPTVAATAAPAQGAAAPAAAQKPAPPPAQFATSADGTKIAFEKGGSGPALLLIHGGGQTRKSWADSGYIDPLRKQFTTIAVDLRGSGESDKPTTADAYALDKVLADLTAVADAAGAKRFHVMGFGHGATIGRYLAARSDRVISAVLVGATMGPAVDGLVKDALTAMRARWQALLEQKRAGTLNMNTLTPGDKSALEGGMAVTALANGALVDYPPVEPADIKAPTLWLMGAADTSGMDNVQKYREKLAGSKVTFKQIDNTTYSDSFGKPDLVLPLATPFLTAPSGSG